MDEKLKWANGKVSAAAYFMDKVTKYVKPGTTILAILPDVLRSGSRYQVWRDMIDQRCIVDKIKLLGQFDKYADVDVYAVCLTKREEEKKQHPTHKKKVVRSNNLLAIDDLFDVCVGPVVDNRDIKKGPLRPYVISKGLKSWSTTKNIEFTRRHMGKAFQGPLVVIKRTSRMGDTHRALATIVNCKNDFYVDNHLIVLIPKSKTLRDCKEVLSSLKDTRTTQWLNEKIRCRHLTTQIVSNIPIWERIV